MKRAVQLLCVLSLTAAAILAQHDHGEEDVFHEVQEFFGLNGTTIPRQETNVLIRYMLYRLGCNTNAEIDCTACLKTDKILAYLNRTTENSLDEEAFHMLSVILVVFMKNPEVECANSDATLDPGGRTFKEFLEGFSEGEEHLDHILEEVLHEMDTDYKNGKLVLNSSGDHISGPTIDYSSVIECMSPETILEHLELSSSAEVTDERLEHMASYIVAKVLQGYCLSPEGLPIPSNFLASLFATYADKTTLKIKLEVFESMLKKIGIGGGAHDDHGHDDHGHGHDEHEHAAARRKRDTEITREGRFKRAAGHDHDDDHAGETHEGGHSETFDVSENCYSAEKLLDVFVGASNTTPSVDTKTFMSLSPAIVQQFLSGACEAKEEPTDKTSTSAEAYGYGTLSVFIITLCTLLGAPFVAIRNATVKRRMLTFFIAVAIGTLLGDAALHLIPQATGIHAHEHGHEHSTEEIEIEPYVWKMLALLASLYAFFLLELVMSKTPGSHSHSADISNGDIPEKTDNHTEVTKPINRSLVVMICLGDAVHNFADGLAIGAAYSISVAGGLSTSIAIFCHELPHELGDFAALISGGLTIKKAMVMNFISGCTAFIGLFVGVALGSETESSAWIFVLAAGMFIYVALADLVPEMTRMFKEASDTIVAFLLINAGLLIGFGLMFIIAVFESHIRVLV